MSQRKRRIKSCFLILLFFGLFQWPQRADGEELDCSQIKTIEDFRQLDDLRGELIDQVVELESKITSLKKEIPDDPATTKAEINDLKERLKNLKGASDEIQTTSKNYTNRINELQRQLDNADEVKKQLDEAEKTLKDKKAKLDCIKDRIHSLYTPEQNFKSRTSYLFAALIGLVIIGFFVLSWYDEQIRRAIFKGESGIQFLTLFSLVIAIILFGVTGILQDKELAALLGGLSGYILGRYNSPEKKPPPANANAADEPEEGPDNNA
jgi:predicted  nucleic acid-binding Zn-ribbon protein